jgi:NADPH:quinone reductase-like Zn-dependent oxidoreductase
MGAWAEYAVTEATSLFVIPKDVSMDQAALSLVNPLTVLAMLETV